MRLGNRLSLMIAGLVLPLAAQADTFRCNGQIIEQGMNQDQVLQYCGQPDATNNQVRISWTYNDQPGGVDIVVYFYANGDVEAIESKRD